MKANFNRKSLLEAFAMVSGVVPTRSPKPILQNMRLDVEVNKNGETEVILSGTDLEVGIRRLVDGVIVIDEGSVILPTVRFGSILKTSNDAEITVETEGDKLLVKAGRSKFSLPNEDAATFPQVSDFDSEVYAILVASDLKTLIRRTSFATDFESSRFALGGALIERGKESFSMVCTDGRRLAKMTVAAEHFGGLEVGGQTIVPSKFMGLVSKALDDDGDQVHLAIKPGTAVVLRTKDCVIYSRLVEGRFPAYEAVFPTSKEYTVPLSVGTLKTSIEQAMICTSQESRGVDFIFETDTVKMTATVADVGESLVVLPLETTTEGLDMKVAADPSFIVDALKTLEPEAVLTLDLIDAKSPMVFRVGEFYTYVVMPLTR